MKFVPSPDGRSDREKMLYPYTVENYLGHWTIFLDGSPVKMFKQLEDRLEDETLREKVALHAHSLNVQHASQPQFQKETAALQFRMRERHRRQKEAAQKAIQE